MNGAFRQNLVSKTIWPWQTSKSSTSTGPSLFLSLITLTVGLMMAGLFVLFHHNRMALLVVGISLAVFLCSRFFPKVYRGLEKVFQGFSHLVGQALTWLLLLPFFYVFFVGGRLLQKITGKDPMSRAWDRNADSYWCNKIKGSDPEQYKRQF